MASRVAVLKALAHPLRLRVVDRLGHRGPAPVSRLAAELGASLPELSQGLRVLRDAGVVEASRSGRTSVYALARDVDRLLPLLDRIVGERAAPAAAGGGPSRTCYDHLAGPLGVALYRELTARGALGADGDGTVTVLDWDVLADYGVDRVEHGRRRLAFECLDATEHAPHLAGALGDALAAALFARGSIERAPGSARTVSVLDDGLQRLLGGGNP
jgi:DNA-binding transcriptional ArsR family regulator